MRRPAPRRIAAVVALGLGLSGCVGAGGCAEPTVRLEATVTDGGMTPSDLAACRDQEVTLVLDSETDGTLHIHGYDEQVPATTLEAGKSSSLQFTADVAGQFIIELHAHSGGDETEIGVFTVIEP